MTKKQEVLKLAKHHKAHVDGGLSGRYFHYDIWTPKGMTWQANGCHVISLGFSKFDDMKYREEEWQDALERMQYGITECDDPECEYCCPVEESTDE